MKTSLQRYMRFALLLCAAGSVMAAPATGAGTAQAAATPAAATPAAATPDVATPDVATPATENPAAAARATTGGAGNAKAEGERIVMQGNGKGAAPCMACHGARGEGNAQTVAPRLAGLPQAYLEKQLADYAGDARRHELMQPQAKALAPAERSAVAAYYAALPPPRPAATQPKKPPAAQQKAWQRGRQLVTAGDESLQIQACANCHGPEGRGVDTVASPYLAGQQGSYLRATLEAWHSGARRNDPSGQMPAIAKRLRPADIEAIATYLERLAQ